MHLTISRLAKAFVTTTPIFYVNAAPHIGHLYTALVADAYTRFRRLRYPDEKSLLITGTDEHGIKIQNAAKAAGIQADQFCSETSAQYRKLFNLCSIDYSDFIRTTEPRHRRTVEDMWRKIYSAGHISKATYEGWYCVPDETFIPESQTTLTDNGTRISLESGHPVEWSQEENYVFNIGAFTERISKWLDANDVIKPNIFRSSLNYILDSETSIKELSVSRSKSRLHWGIPVPDDDDQVIYVWMDALANYLTVSGDSWPADVHIVGKDILKFHAVFWPAFLMAADLELPRKIQVHSHWLVNHEKMSKSKGNVVDPYDHINRFTAEGLRYFLLREGVPHSDGNYSEKKIIDYLNAELANNLGNLLSRCTAKSVNKNLCFPPVTEESFSQNSSEHAKEILKSLNDLRTDVANFYENFEFYRGIDQILACLRETNAYVQTEQPWELKKSNGERLDVVLRVTLEVLRVSGILLQPVLPVLSGKLLDKLQVKSRLWSDAQVGDILVSSPILEDKVILFRQIK